VAVARRAALVRRRGSLRGDRVPVEAVDLSERVERGLLIRGEPRRDRWRNPGQDARQRLVRVAQQDMQRVEAERRALLLLISELRRWGRGNLASNGTLQVAFRLCKLAGDQIWELTRSFDVSIAVIREHERHKRRGGEAQIVEIGEYIGGRGQLDRSTAVKLSGLDEAAVAELGVEKVRCAWLEDDDRGGETAVRTAAEELITNCLTTIAKQVAAPQRNELLTGSERPGQIDNQLSTSRRRLKRRGARRLEVWRRLVLPPHLVSTARSRAVILDGQGLDQIAFLGMGGANDGGCRETRQV